MIKIILLAYLLLINIITYFTYAADKTKARQNKWRIPERTLILLALLGGSPARPPRHETLPPQNPPPEIQIRNPYYSNHSNSNYIFSLPPYLKYLIPSTVALQALCVPFSQSFKFRPSISPGSPPKRMVGHSITLSGLGR